MPREIARVFSPRPPWFFRKILANPPSFPDFFKRMFHFYFGFHKNRRTPCHNILWQGVRFSVFIAICGNSRRIPSFCFVIFYKIFEVFLDHSSVDAGSSVPLILARCSCILAAEAARKFVRDCLTSVRAICMASSARARASSV